MKTLHHTPLLLCLCLGLGSAWADTPIQLQHAATPTAQISVSNIAGTVRITAWDRPLLQVGGLLGEGAKPLVITGSDDKLALKVEAGTADSGWFHWGNQRMGPTTLELHVPRGAALTVNVVSANLAIDGTAGGNITVNATSGRTRINAHTPRLSVDSVSGNIELAGLADQANLQTVSGDILAPALGAQAKLQTVSGHIQASGGPWQSLAVSSVSGDAQLGGSLAPGGKLSVDSMSGDVQLQLPASSSASVHASSFSGDLRSDVGKVQEADHGPGSTLDARLGNGNGTVKLESFSGDLRIRLSP